VTSEWVLLRDLADELGIHADHVERWSIWTAAGFRPTRLTIRSKTGVIRRWAVTTEQAQRLRKLRASALVLS